MENHYEVLEVAQNATKKDIKKSYYRLAKKYHPDHNQNDPTAAEKFKAVGEAYRVLSDDAARAEYDRQLAQGPATQKTAAARGRTAGGPVRKPQPKAPGASAQGINFQHLNESFASFWGYDPKTKQVTNEEKLNTFVEKDRKKNPLDTTDMFERIMGFKK